MCICSTHATATAFQDWDGLYIIPDPIVPSHRPNVGNPKLAYDTDVREFLVTDKNAVVRRCLERDLSAFIAAQQLGTWAQFTARKPGCFDFRARAIVRFVSDHVRYEYSGKADPWQFPDETLSLKSGDCEDRAILIAALLLASGVSSFCVRVALGTVTTFAAGSKPLTHQHAWVMYKTEAGQWRRLEPAVNTPASARSAKDGATRTRPRIDHTVISPLFLFNDQHLWGCTPELAQRANAAKSRLGEDWSTLDPQFAGITHRYILDAVLKRFTVPSADQKYLTKKFTAWFWNPEWTVDEVDAGTYDPRDHFDNAYIDEGWQRVNGHWDSFAALAAGNRHGALDHLYRSLHGTADFYAHSSYSYLWRKNPVLRPVSFAGGRADYDLAPSEMVYGAGSPVDLSKPPYTINPAVYPGPASAAPQLWAGRIISGRYGQRHDSHGLLEAFFNIPAELTAAPDFARRGALPHHNELAVDDVKENAYEFNRRRTAAIEHLTREVTTRGIWSPKP